MTVYEELLQKVADHGLTVHEHYDLGNDSTTEDNYLLGLYCEGHIALAEELQDDLERRAILAEEFAHSRITTGNILDQSDPANRKQEYAARLLSYDTMFGIDGIAKALRKGCKSVHEMAEHLQVPEKIMYEALELYKEKYGIKIETDDYELYFEPYLMLIDK